MKKTLLALTLIMASNLHTMDKSAAAEKETSSESTPLIESLRCMLVYLEEEKAQKIHKELTSNFDMMESCTNIREVCKSFSAKCRENYENFQSSPPQWYQEYKHALNLISQRIKREEINPSFIETNFKSLHEAFHRAVLKISTKAINIIRENTPFEVLGSELKNAHSQPQSAALFQKIQECAVKSEKQLSVFKEGPLGLEIKKLQTKMKAEKSRVLALLTATAQAKADPTKTKQATKTKKRTTGFAGFEAGFLLQEK